MMMMMMRRRRRRRLPRLPSNDEQRCQDRAAGQCANDKLIETSEASWLSQLTPPTLSARAVKKLTEQHGPRARALPAHAHVGTHVRYQRTRAALEIAKANWGRPSTVGQPFPVGAFAL